MKKKAFLNILCTTLSQLVTIASGLIVPRLLLSTFGSEANGLVSSITQFLNYIALVEGGIGSVVLASLYKPLAESDNNKLSRVLKASNRFFNQIAFIFLGYTIVLGCVYPFLIQSDYSWVYVFSLTLILAVGSFVQYCFSINYKLLLQADHKMYIVQLVNIAITTLNIITVFVAIKLWPELHIVKLASALLFILQPIIYSAYVKKHYQIDKNVEPDEKALSQRWSCFGQNFAYFIHANTDIVVLSVFTNLKLVSVYSVYFLIVEHIQKFFKSFSHAFTPIIGKAISVKETIKANRYLDLYEFVVFNVSTVVFGCCIYLLPSFIMIYTHGVTDADYSRPVFSTIIVLAEYIYCVRDPYVSVIYAAGRFKETSLSAYIEAAINIVLSVSLVIWFGLEGIAVGTLIGMTYRMVYMIIYLKKHVVHRPIYKSLKRLAISLAAMAASVGLMCLVDTTGSATLLLWVKNAVLSVLVFGAVTLILDLIFDRELTLWAFRSALKRNKQKKG